MTPPPRTWRSAPPASPLRRTSLALTITATPGRRSSTDFPSARWCAWCAKIQSAKGCFMPGTDTGVFVSWDDGDHWQSLQLNLPADAGDRSRGTRQRPGHLNLRTRLVDPGRRHAAARDQPADRCRATFTCFVLPPPCACAGTTIRTRRIRSKLLPGRIRPMEPSSTTS